MHTYINAYISAYVDTTKTTSLIFCVCVCKREANESSIRCLYPSLLQDVNICLNVCFNIILFGFVLIRFCITFKGEVQLILRCSGIAHAIFDLSAPENVAFCLALCSEILAIHMRAWFVKNHVTSKHVNKPIRLVRILERADCFITIFLMLHH